MQNSSEVSTILAVHLKSNDHESGQLECTVFTPDFITGWKQCVHFINKIKEIYRILQLFMRCILLNFQTKGPNIEN